jgi:hypothetical protein
MKKVTFTKQDLFKPIRTFDIYKYVEFDKGGKMIEGSRCLAVVTKHRDGKNYTDPTKVVALKDEPIEIDIKYRERATADFIPKFGPVAPWEDKKVAHDARIQTFVFETMNPSQFDDPRCGELRDEILAKKGVNVEMAQKLVNLLVEMHKKACKETHFMMLGEVMILNEVHKAIEQARTVIVNEKHEREMQKYRDGHKLISVTPITMNYEQLTGQKQIDVAELAKLKTLQLPNFIEDKLQ